jgi:hypothetical protein
MVHPVWEPGLGVRATGISCVARSSELRAVRVNNGTRCTLQVHPLPRRVRTHNDMLKNAVGVMLMATPPLAQVLPRV